MAVIAPQTDVYLLKVPLEIDNANQLTFANATAQFNYFNSCPKLAVDDFTYQRKDGTIRFGANFDDLIGYNYVMYRNDAYSNKWFYAFIDNMSYMNDNMTAISISTDYWQTWQFDLHYKACFVEREHVNDDTLGKHTVPEGLETGEYIINNGISGKQEILLDNDAYPYGADRSDPTKKLNPQKYFITFQVTKIDPIINDIPETTYMKVNGIFNGTYIFATDTPEYARKIISLYDHSSTASGDDIVSIFLSPVPLFDNGYIVNITEGGSTVAVVIIPHTSDHNNILKKETFFARPTKIDGYTPRNAKCFCYPYAFVNIDNHVGGMSTFHYEDFDNHSYQGNDPHSPSFIVEGALSQGCSVILAPTFYKGDDNRNLTYGIPGAKFPQCSWKSDYYTNWCVQNAISQPFGAVGAVGQAGVSLLTALAFSNPITAIAGAVGLIGSIGNSMSARYEAERHPNQIKGQQSDGDLLVGANSGTHTYYTLFHMCCKKEYIKQIDSFFDMFGYKVNEVKIPNITGRANWNYVKTIGCYIQADIPQEDLQEIKSMFDKGVTFWHNPSTFCDYSQSNAIITP